MPKRQEPIPAGVRRRIVSRLIDDSPLVALYLFAAHLSAGWMLGLLLLHWLHPLAWRMADLDTPGKILTSSQVVKVDTWARVGFGRFFWRWLLWSLIPGIISILVFIAVFYWLFSGWSNSDAAGDPLAFLAMLGISIALSYLASMAVYVVWYVLQLIFCAVRADGAALHDLIAETRVVILTVEDDFEALPASDLARPRSPTSTGSWEDPAPAPARRTSYLDYID